MNVLCALIVLLGLGFGLYSIEQKVDRILAILEGDEG